MSARVRTRAPRGSPRGLRIGARVGEHGRAAGGVTERSSGPGRGHIGVRTLVRVMRLLLSPRWMVWHVLTLGAMVTCTWLAIWQWGRAGSAMGSALNVGYGLQWPLFAVFFGVMWWRFLSMEIADLRAAEAAGTSGDSAGATDTDQAQAAGAAPSPVAGTTPSAVTTTARTAAATTATTPATTPVVPTATTPDGPTAAPTPAGTTAAPAGPSPFTSRPANAVPPRSTDPQLRAYNEELARLAARHREESTP
ncbi:hypothetical protein [Pseudonocardia sp. EV170527-09]|uniref:hypothetical protein n=1 Tax=Pseudonocardia sp. EV170527-09 TaxID=2603411 RepID=UPI001EFF66AE|nr:hypothetical protein [Pseudonocardia sp. EV170527-09]